MKCTNCGKNNAVYHYSYNINGNVTEAHLCAECAGKSPERELAAMSRELFGDVFGADLFGADSFPGPVGRMMGGLASPAGGLFDGFFGSGPFGGLFGTSPLPSPFAALGGPRIEITFPDLDRAGANPEDRSGTRAEPIVDPELSRRREINALREQMRSAAQSEDYELAAKLRDKLRKLENSGEQGQSNG